MLPLSVWGKDAKGGHSSKSDCGPPHSPARLTEYPTNACRSRKEGMREGMMLKLKLQYFGHLMQRVDSLEKTLMLGGIGFPLGRQTTRPK